MAGIVPPVDTYPLHSLLALLLGETEGLEVGLLPSDEVAVGSHACRSPPGEGRADTAGAVVDENRARQAWGTPPAARSHGPDSCAARCAASAGSSPARPAR